MPPRTIRLAHDGERREALAILYSNLRPCETAEHVEITLDLSGRGSFSLAGLNVCVEDGRILGAILMMISAGRSMLVWPPRTVGLLSERIRGEVISELLESAIEFGRSGAVRFGQLLLGREDEPLKEVAEHHGFRCLTRLLHMSRRSSPLTDKERENQLELVTFSVATEERFCEVMRQSYVGSLDCPELNGARTMEEILASHRAQGEFDPRNWFLASRDGVDVGCLLLARLQDVKACEIAYVATVEKSRKQGVGKALTRHAIRRANALGCEFVTLSVDSRNVPAVQLYRAAGFESWDERDAYLLFLDPLDGKFNRGIANPPTLPYH